LASAHGQPIPIGGPWDIDKGIVTISRILIVLLCFFWSSTAWASPLNTAEALIEHQDTQQAIALLEDYTPASVAEQERRLWALAVAYGREQRPRKALPVLEKLVSLNPRSATYRLELASALMAAEQDDRAHYHFSLLRGSVDDPETAAALDARLETLNRRKSWQGFFSFALTPETNAARRTAADSIVIGGLPILIDPAAREQSATGVRVILGGALLPRLGKDTRARIGLSFDGRFFGSDKAFDDVTVTGRLGLVTFGDRARQISATLHTAQRWIDGNRYSLTSGLTLRYGQLIGQSGALLMSARLQQIDYDRPGLRTARETRLQMRYAHNLSPRFQLYGSGYVEDRSTPSAADAGSTLGLTVGTQYLFTGGLQIGLEVERSRLSRDGPHPLLGIRRQDERFYTTLRVSNRNWQARGFTPLLELGFERQNSSLALYEYDNTRLSIGLTRAF
jgi:tetratricopeptide (TPR) repeat protein